MVLPVRRQGRCPPRRDDAHAGVGAQPEGQHSQDESRWDKFKSVSSWQNSEHRRVSNAGTDHR